VRLFGATRAVIGDLISAEKCTEPVFGQIKQARGFRRFLLLRGVKKVRAEWAMICTTHNQRPSEAATVQQMPGRNAYLDGLLA
jgi:hypothetical protein